MNYYVSSGRDDVKYPQVPASPPSLFAGLMPSSLCMCVDGATPLLVGNLLSAQLPESSEVSPLTF